MLLKRLSDQRNFIDISAIYRKWAAPMFVVHWRNNAPNYKNFADAYWHCATSWSYRWRNIDSMALGRFASCVRSWSLMRVAFWKGGKASLLWRRYVINISLHFGEAPWPTAAFVSLTLRLRQYISWRARLGISKVYWARRWRLFRYFLTALSRRPDIMSYIARRYLHQWSSWNAWRVIVMSWAASAAK